MELFVESMKNCKVSDSFGKVNFDGNNGYGKKIEIMPHFESLWAGIINQRVKFCP